MCDTGFMKEHTLVTGASGGIGLELAIIAANNGNNLVLVARDKAGLDAARSKILERTQGDRLQIEILALDLSKPESPREVFDFCISKNIFISTLINNAGFGDYGEFAKTDLKRQLSMIDLNVRAVTELTHLFLPAMITKNKGKIMNLGSVASFLPGPLMSVYFAGKNYVLRFSEALSEELRDTGVTVTCLCPGSTKTNFGKSARVSPAHSTLSSKTTAAQVAEFGWRHLQKGTRVAIYGWNNRLALLTSRFVPRNLLGKLVKKIQK